MMASLLLAAALAGQAGRPPAVRYVSLPDSYAPDLAPGEVLVPGSVYDVVPEGTAYAQPAAPRPSASAAAPSPQAVPSSSCYASSYQPGATSYRPPAPAASYVIPSCPGGACGRVIESTPWPQAGPQYAEPRPTARPAPRRERLAEGRARRPRLGFGLALAQEREVRSRTGLNLGFYPTDRQPSLFSGERWGGRNP
jgi:hypothetical protein